MRAPTTIEGIEFERLDTRPARPPRRRPTVVEAGQLVCALVALAGLFMIVPVGWFLLMSGLAGLALMWAIERKDLASASPTESDGT